METRYLTLLAILFLIFENAAPVFADIDVLESNSKTTKALVNKRLCTEGIKAVARHVFDKPAGDLHLGIERHFGQMVSAMAKSNKITAEQEEKIKGRIKKLLGGASHVQSPWLEHSLAAVFRNEDIDTFNDIDLWLCFGINCSPAEVGYANEANLPFNYLIRDAQNIKPEEDLQSKVVQQDVIAKAKPSEKLPHPNIGLSRIEAVYLAPPASFDDASIDSWLANAMKEISIYFVHQNLSKWTTRNSVLSGASKDRDPLFAKNISLHGRVYVIDPAFYSILMVGIKYQVKLASLKALKGAASAQEESEIQAEAWKDDFQARVSADTLTRFEQRNNIKITQQNLFAVANEYLSAIRASNKETQLVQSLHVYPDPSFGLMPVRFYFGTPPP